MEALSKVKYVSHDDPELTSAQINHLKRLLLDHQEKLIFKDERTIDLNLDEEERSDDVDHANADMSNFQKIRFRTRESVYQKKIMEALKRIDDAEYGLCEECGNNISYARLLARPTAELCIQCKEEAEREEMLAQGGNLTGKLAVSQYP